MMTHRLSSRAAKVRVTYPLNVVRLCLVWKADLDPEANSEFLDLDLVMRIFIADLPTRGVDFRVPSDPLRPGWPRWIA
jgi:hypothetical protein